MKIILANKNYSVIDTKARITVADSFVANPNKIGTGNGEAKLYVGQASHETDKFFGTQAFVAKCFLIKSDLVRYLEETRHEYLKPEQPYRDKRHLPRLWKERKAKVGALPELVEFTIRKQAQIAGPRIYVNSTDSAYKLIRELSLPNITFISVVKVKDSQKRITFYFRLFADYFGEVTHPDIIQEEIDKIKLIPDTEIRNQLTTARKGQGEYRKKLLLICPFCPITMVSDERILIASHIKPWRFSTNKERLDPLNGFMLTPTFDRLFDRGFLSFTDDKRTILSPHLSKMVYSRIGISHNRLIPHLPIAGREAYLDYHRKKYF